MIPFLLQDCVFCLDTKKAIQYIAGTIFLIIKGFSWHSPIAQANLVRFQYLTKK